MKFSEIAILTKNRTNNQNSFVLKARKLKKLNITPEKLLMLDVPNVLFKKNNIKKEVEIWNKKNKK